MEQRTRAPCTDHHEWEEVHGDAEGEVDVLDALQQSHQLPARVKKGDGFSQGAEVDGLACQLAGSESN